MKILVVTGASGGHIFPAVSFLEKLKEKNKEIDALLVLPRNLKSQIIPETYKVKHISTTRINLNFNYRNFIAIFSFLKGTFESLFLIAEFKPDMVVGFGSLNSLPLVLIAWVFRIKTLIHEQNVIPGRANRFLARFADKIAISFDQTKHYLKARPEKIMLTGNPLRRELNIIQKNAALNFFGFVEFKFTVLVMGGSLGSSKINACFLDAISMIPQRDKLQIIHLTGSQDFDLLNNKYKDLSIKAKLFSFLKDMQYAYSASDLAICRAGATTIAELIKFCLPAIIIPYPFAYGHQAANAKVLKEAGSALVIEDNELNSRSLKEIIVEFINDRRKIEKMRQGFDSMSKPAASDLLVEDALNLALS